MDTFCEIRSGFRVWGFGVGVHHAGLRGEKRGGVVDGWLRVVDCLKCLDLISGFGFRVEDSVCLGWKGAGLWGEGSGVWGVVS